MLHFNTCVSDVEFYSNPKVTFTVNFEWKFGNRISILREVHKKRKEQNTNIGIAHQGQGNVLRQVVTIEFCHSTHDGHSFFVSSFHQQPSWRLWQQPKIKC